ncbi:uncharacterized protein CTHT_0014100 [Thermochaetoides thermophila DSM 1495]|uniref:Peptidase A1 domain-containing protein n=1 Tax=Chaetomium thermophilum (strain DSM 1495 / CBS 144.50 / IMI 039719) TaxID=759272 RepID=G0S1M2_CHATD|nr:hypothetical protein CTHT_0014100 [Thermochaetoides thermophila DSM 1495]EGS22932.1 hypothetical protein CTHT_0014100 [Thermochaetoides thermophila DSM 1495]
MRFAPAPLLALASGALARNVVQFNVTKGPPGVRIGSVSYLNRRGTFAENLINNVAGGGYFIEVQIGTPPQPVTMLLDTGSSDAWVLSREADLCKSRELQELYGMTCAGTYNPDKSSTHHMVERNGFKIVYLDGNSASGDYISDDFIIGDTMIKGLQMACVTKAVRGTGILGLGFSENEKAKAKYPNIMDEMVNQGLIRCKAYSLYLNDRRTDSGNILFGGVDLDKFIGQLQIVPLYKTNGSNYTSFEIAFDGVSLIYTNGTTIDVSTSILGHAAPAVLDSGTTFSYLPDPMTRPIYSALGAIYDPDLRSTIIDCKYLTSEPNLHLTFHFGNTTAGTAATISVPVWEMVLDILPASYTHPGFTRPCLFGIQSTAAIESVGTVKDSSNFTLLGDTFLRSAYVVYDLTHHQIGLAQANLNSSTSTVVELHSTGTSLPNLSGVPSQQTTYTPTPTLFPSRSGSEDPNSEESKNAAAPAVGVMELPGWGTSGGLGEILSVVGMTGAFALFGGALIAL